MAINKLLVMAPIMLLARKLDATDQNLVFKLRVAYTLLQCVLVLCLMFIYKQARAMKESTAGKKKIFVPAQASPFADPKANKKYSEVEYGTHVMATAMSLLGSTIFGILITAGLHLYKGIIVGMAMQLVMGPLGFYENPLVKLFFFGEKKVFNEKSKEELAPEDEIVDDEGKPVAKPKPAAPAVKSEEKKERSFEEILLDTWDQGSEADIAPLMDALNESNANYRTKESEWTPIMVVSGLGAKNCASAMRHMKSLGADPSLVDAEGWNALHWAAFHGSVDAIKVLLSEEDFDGIKMGLHTVGDRGGLVPLKHAEMEGNKAAAKLISEIIEQRESTQETSDEGLRKRK